MRRIRRCDAAPADGRRCSFCRLPLRGATAINEGSAAAANTLPHRRTGEKGRGEQARSDGELKRGRGCILYTMGVCVCVCVCMCVCVCIAAKRVDGLEGARSLTQGAELGRQLEKPEGRGIRPEWLALIRGLLRDGLLTTYIGADRRVGTANAGKEGGWGNGRR